MFGIECELVGPPGLLQPMIERYAKGGPEPRIVPAADGLPMDVSPREGIRDHPNCSLLVAARRARDIEGHSAMVTAGPTGAVVLACSKTFERIPGIRRTALAAVIPTARRRGERDDPFSLILDVGATVRVDAEDLVGFAVMGAAYSAMVSKSPAPRLGVLSNGTEPNKGPPEVVEALKRLRGMEGIELVGNIEAQQIPRGEADVIVCDGFSGNITLKMLEGIQETVLELGRYAQRSRLTWRIGLWLLRSGLSRLRQVTDWRQYGGAPILGHDRLCIKAHGRSGPRAIRNAIRVADMCTRDRLCETIAARSQQTLDLIPSAPTDSVEDGH